MRVSNRPALINALRETLIRNMIILVTKVLDILVKRLGKVCSTNNNYPLKFFKTITRFLFKKVNRMDKYHIQLTHPFLPGVD